MKTIRKIFDPQQYFNRVDELLGMLSKEERMQWLQHPCTQALVLQMEGEFIAQHEVWENGGFASDTVDGTALKSEAARGYIGCLHDISNFLEGVPEDD